MQKILSLSQLQDSNAGLDFQATGRMITPLGASLLHTPELEGGKIIGLDKNCALEMVQAGGVVTDYDKLIDRQLERAAVTCTAGFQNLYRGVKGDELLRRDCLEHCKHYKAFCIIQRY